MLDWTVRMRCRRGKYLERRWSMIEDNYQTCCMADIMIQEGKPFNSHTAVLKHPGPFLETEELRSVVSSIEKGTLFAMQDGPVTLAACKTSMSVYNNTSRYPCLLLSGIKTADNYVGGGYFMQLVQKLASVCVDAGLILAVSVGSNSGMSRIVLEHKESWYPCADMHVVAWRKTLSGYHHK